MSVVVRARHPDPAHHDAMGLATDAELATAVLAGATPDATTVVKGKVRLAGDLAGTATSPTVPGLATKVDGTDARLSDKRVPTDGSVGDTQVSTLSPSKITGTAVVTGDSRLSDNRTPLDGTVTTAKIAAGGIAESAVTGLVSDLEARATDSTVVHNTGAETIDGAKTPIADWFFKSGRPWTDPRAHVPTGTGFDIGDGGAHPLSAVFGSLAAAQAFYPHAISLADEHAWAAVQAAINTGHNVHMDDGTYRINRSLRKVTSGTAPGLVLQGDGPYRTILDNRVAYDALINCDGYGSARTVTDGVTAPSATLTSAMAAFTSADVAGTVTGPGIQPETIIQSVESATSVTLSAPATATASGLTLTIIQPGVLYQFQRDTRLSGFGIIQGVVATQSVGLRMRSQWRPEVDNVRIYQMSSDGIIIVNKYGDADSFDFGVFHQVESKKNGGWGVNTPDPLVHPTNSSLAGCAINHTRYSQCDINENLAGGIRWLGIEQSIEDSSVSYNRAAGGIVIATFALGQSSMLTVSNVELDSNEGVNLDAQSVVDLHVAESKSIHGATVPGLPANSPPVGLRIGQSSDVNGRNVYNAVVDGIQCRVAAGGNATLFDVKSSSIAARLRRYYLYTPAQTEVLLDNGRYTVLEDDQNIVFPQKPKVIAVSVTTTPATVTPRLVPGGVNNASPGGNRYRVSMDAGSSSLTIGDPVLPGNAGFYPQGMQLGIRIKNNSGGAITVSWHPRFSITGFVPPPVGSARTLLFEFDATAVRFELVGYAEGTPTPAHASTHAPGAADDLTSALSAGVVPAPLAAVAALGTGTGFSRQGHVHPWAGLGQPPQVDVYTTPGTYTITPPAGKTQWKAKGSSGGGGGGGGRRGPSGTIQTGGAGGGSGAVSEGSGTVAGLVGTISLFLGAAGTSGAAATADNTDGGNGGTGGDFWLGVSQATAIIGALGGTGGSGGKSAAASVGGTGGTGMFPGGAGGADAATGAAGTGAAHLTVNGPGGAGGGITATPAASAGGTGGIASSRRGVGVAPGGAIGAAGATTTAPNGGLPVGGGGAGGGGSSIVGPGGNGGDAVYGGGGGGGGAALNGNNSGAGGAGGPTWAIIEWT